MFTVTTPDREKQSAVARRQSAVPGWLVRTADCRLLPAYWQSRDGRTRTDGSVFPKHVGLPLPYIPSSQNGWIRTSTVHHLKVTPPGDWATCADGGRWRDRTSAPLRARRASNALPYLSANRPGLAEAAGVEPARPCGTHGFRDRPPHQRGLRFHDRNCVCWCPELDSNQQHLRSERSASTRLDYRGVFSWDGRMRVRARAGDRSA